MPRRTIAAIAIAFFIGAGFGVTIRATPEPKPIPTPTPRIVYVPSPVPSTVYVPSPVPVPEDRRECLAQIARLAQYGQIAYETLKQIGDALIEGADGDFAAAYIAVVDVWTAGAEAVVNLDDLNSEKVIDACD